MFGFISGIFRRFWPKVPDDRVGFGTFVIESDTPERREKSDAASAARRIRERKEYEEKFADYAANTRDPRSDPERVWRKQCGTSEYRGHWYVWCKHTDGVTRWLGVVPNAGMASGFSYPWLYAFDLRGPDIFRFSGPVAALKALGRAHPPRGFDIGLHYYSEISVSGELSGELPVVPFDR